MKKTVVLDEKLGELILRTRGEVMSRAAKDIGFSSILNFFAWAGAEYLSKLDQDALNMELRRMFEMPDEEMELQESVAEVEDRLREKIEKGLIAISSKISI